MACKEEDGLRLCHSNRLELHSATIRRWRATTPFLTGRLYKVALAVHWSQEAIGSAFQCFKRQSRVGANPKGHGRPGRPYDNEREVLAILDRRSHFGPESCTRWPWRPIRSAKPLHYRLKSSGVKLGSAPFQRVSVAQSDQRQLEGAGSHFLPRRSRRASLDIHWTRQAWELSS